jgi:glycosyltransferase involved in cell wall biosynthesis
MRILAQPGIHSRLNPYTMLLYTEFKRFGEQVNDYSWWKALRYRYDVYHLHWPEYYVAHPNPLKTYLGSAIYLLLVAWSRARGARIVWTIHNLGSHNQSRPRTEKFFWEIFTRQVDGYIVLTEHSRTAAQERFPRLAKLPATVIPHGLYGNAYANNTTAIQARRRLQLPESARVVLFFGNIAPYKNLFSLTAALRQLKQQDVVLLVAGGCSFKEQEDQLRTESKNDPRIRPYIGFVPADEVQYFFLACDLVVLPFQEILNSGSALLALTFSRPLLVPAKGGMSELQIQFGQEWVRTYAGEFCSEVLASALAWATNNARPERPNLPRLSWEHIAEQTLAAYRRIIASGATLQDAQSRIA